MIEKRSIPQVIEAWPTPIAQYFLNRDITDKEKEAALELTQELQRNEGNSHSVTVEVLEHPDMADIKSFCLESVKSFCKHILNIVDTVEPFITISWINITEKGQAHHRHSHPNSIVSGVFYLNANSEVDNIMFYKPEYRRIHYIHGNTTKYNSDVFQMPVHSGDLLLFDSSVEHSVLPTTGDHIRMSLSFNTFLKGTIGTKQTLTYLDLTGE